MIGKIKQIPTLVGLAVLIIGVTAGVYLIRQAPNWFLRASPQTTPKEVKTTNISDTGFSVSWITDSETSGLINYGINNDISFTADDDRIQMSGGLGSFLTHHVTLKELQPSTTYYFKINSGGTTYDNNGQPYQITTGPKITQDEPPNDMADGNILDKNGNPVEGAIVYLALANATTQSTITRASGNWVIPLNLARSSDLSGYVSYDKDASIEEINVQAGKDETAQAITTTKKDDPVEPITLGNNYDFRTTADTSDNSDIDTTGDINLSSPEPDITPATSASTLDTSPLPSPSIGPEAKAKLEIINPDQKEKINTNTPQITGKGPAGQIVTVEIHSNSTTTGSVKINSDGTWDWTPPAGLTPGIHTVTATLADGTKVTKNFTVLAADTSDLPSLTSSPSAIITPTIASRSSMPATTSSKLDKTGVLTPTITIFMIGSVLIILGFFSIKKLDLFV